MSTTSHFRKMLWSPLNSDRLAGVTADRCGCCQMCARSEGQLCDDDSNKKNGALGICGENLVCAKRDDVPGVRRTTAYFVWLKQMSLGPYFCRPSRFASVKCKRWCAATTRQRIRQFGNLGILPKKRGGICIGCLPRDPGAWWSGTRFVDLVLGCSTIPLGQ